MSKAPSYSTPAYCSLSVSDFVQPGSSKEINISFSTRTQVQRSVDSLCNVDGIYDPQLAVFEQAKREILGLLQRDSFPRFSRAQKQAQAQGRAQTQAPAHSQGSSTTTTRRRPSRAERFLLAVEGAFVSNSCGLASAGQSLFQRAQAHPSVAKSHNFEVRNVTQALTHSGCLGSLGAGRQRNISASKYQS